MGTKTSTTPKREYDSLIDQEIRMIGFFTLYGPYSECKAAKKRLQQWYRLQAEQEGKR